MGFYFGRSDYESQRVWACCCLELFGLALGSWLQRTDARFGYDAILAYGQFVARFALPACRS
jgi:hypothetical protein